MTEELCTNHLSRRSWINSRRKFEMKNETHLSFLIFNNIKFLEQSKGKHRIQMSYKKKILSDFLNVELVLVCSCSLMLRTAVKNVVDKAFLWERILVMLPMKEKRCLNYLGASIKLWLKEKLNNNLPTAIHSYPSFSYFLAFSLTKWTFFINE